MLEGGRSEDLLEVGKERGEEKESEVSLSSDEMQVPRVRHAGKSRPIGPKVRKFKYTTVFCIITGLHD